MTDAAEQNALALILRITEHDQQCGMLDTRPQHKTCPCGRLHVLCCGVCGEKIVGFGRPGETPCQHAEAKINAAGGMWHGCELSDIFNLL